MLCCCKAQAEVPPVFGLEGNVAAKFVLMVLRNSLAYCAHGSLGSDVTWEAVLGKLAVCVS